MVLFDSDFTMSSPIKFERKIRRSGASSTVTIPLEIMRALGWKLGDPVLVSIVPEKGILIEKGEIGE